MYDIFMISGVTFSLILTLRESRWNYLGFYQVISEISLLMKWSIENVTGSQPFSDNTSLSEMAPNSKMDCWSGWAFFPCVMRVAAIIFLTPQLRKKKRNYRFLRCLLLPRTSVASLHKCYVLILKGKLQIYQSQPLAGFWCLHISYLLMISISLPWPSLKNEAVRKLDQNPATNLDGGEDIRYFRTHFSNSSNSQD